MIKKSSILFHRIFDILLSISIIMTGIFFMTGCLEIYNSGDQPYSRQAVAEKFASFDVLVYITVILAIVGLIIDLFAKKDISGKPSKQYRNILKNLLEKKDMDKGDAEIVDAIMKQRRNRKFHSVIRTVLICISSAVFLAYALNINNFHKSEINASMINAMWVLLPCLIIPFGYSVFTAYFCEKSYKTEFELVKQLPSRKSENTNYTAARNVVVHAIRVSLITMAVVLLIYGYFSGGTADVLTKAVNICTECIGLG